MLRIGGPIFNPPADPRELARAHRQCGYRAAYVPQELSVKDSGAVKAFSAAFAAEDVALAEAGAWCNLLTPDPVKRAKNFSFVCERLALADALGARCCVDYLGTLDPDSDFGPHPGNLTEAGFERAVATVRSIIDAVKPTRAKFTLEMMQWILPDSVELYLRLIRAVERRAFGVHLDPVNLVLTPRMYFDTGSLLRHCFQQLGPQIASCHAKDLTLRNALALHLDEVPPGKGNMDYETFLSELARLPGEVPLMLEHLSTADEYAAAYRHLASVAQKLKISL